MVVAQVMWLLSGKVSEDIFRKQLERIVGAVTTNLQQQQQGGMPSVVTCMVPVSGCSLLSSPKVSILPQGACCRALRLVLKTGSFQESASPVPS